jgi:Ca-activated chloride channel family protein
MLRLLLANLLLSLVFLAGCEKPPPPRIVLSVLAGSELEDLQPYFDEITAKTGIILQMEFIGTLDGAEKLAGGGQYDLAWFSHGKYLTLLPETAGLIQRQEKIMLSPVIMGVKKSKAASWGWNSGKPVRWSDIADQAAAGKLRFAMTNPASSNSGFTALLGVAAAFSNSPGALTSKDIDKEKLRRFFTGQKLTSGSSGWLAEAFQREQHQLDGLVNYESVLMTLNDSGKLTEPLQLIYPQEGIVTADYPIMLLNKDKKEEFAKLVEYLKSASFQKIIMEKTRRRPVIPEVRPSPAFHSGMLVELPFPADRETIDSLIFNYLDEVRQPSRPTFLLDVSGSMKNQRIDSLRLALKNLTGQDTSLTGRFARFRLREQVTFLPFNHAAFPESTITIDTSGPEGKSMGEIRSLVDNLQAEGGTAIYKALMRAYQLVGEQKRQDPDHYYSIVLLSDGKNEDKTDLNDFIRFYQGQPPEVQAIKTFTILFGNASREEMQQVAELTGGRVFDGQGPSLAAVFKAIRGYQ